MTYILNISSKADEKFKKLTKKNPKQLEIINKKIKQIQEFPQHFKPLSYAMKGIRRVHIDKSFVLTFEIDEQNKIVRVLDYDHHDKTYKR